MVGSQCRWRRWAYLSQVCSLATRGSYTPHNRLKWWNPHLFKTGLNHSQNRVKSFSILLFFSSVEMQYYDILSTINLYMLWLQCRSVYTYEVEWQQNMREKKILLVRSLVCVIRERETVTAIIQSSLYIHSGHTRQSCPVDKTKKMVATHIARKVAAVVKLSLTLSSLLFGTLQTQVVPKLVSRGWMQRRQHRFSYPDCGREIWWPINNQVSLELRAPSNPPKRKGGSGECSTTFLDLRAILVAVANITTISWLPHPTNCSLYYLLSTPLIYWSLVSNFKGLAFSRIHSNS